MNRSLYLTRLVSGATHPDTATIYVSIATMLQELAQHKIALNYLLEALKCYETLVGANHVQTATMYGLCISDVLILLVTMLLLLPTVNWVNSERHSTTKRRITIFCMIQWETPI
jgi:hypothetical protein